MIWIAVAAVITHRTKSVTWNGCRHDGNIPIHPDAPCVSRHAPRTQSLLGTVGGDDLPGQHGRRYGRRGSETWEHVGPGGRRRQLLGYRFWTFTTRNERIVSLGALTVALWSASNVNLRSRRLFMLATKASNKASGESLTDAVSQHVLRTYF